jgi:hypothetical protein
MDCIPAGMELFPAADEEQWDFIKKIIADCDYYLLIIGGRYGTITEQGISYTEKEYDYAVELGLKVIALMHKKPDEIPVNKSETTPELKEKLETFRSKVPSNRLVKYWKEAKDLPGLVALNLPKTIKMFPATGWVRASEVASIELLNEVNELRKEKTFLEDQLAQTTQPISYNIASLADLDELYTVHGSSFNDSGKQAWHCSISWREIFSLISPYLAESANQEYVKLLLHNEFKKKANGQVYRNSRLDDQDFQTICIQLQALNLIKTKKAQTVKGGVGTFWFLTPEGKKLMFQLRAVLTNEPS